MVTWGSGLFEDDLATGFVRQIVEGGEPMLLRALSDAQTMPGHLLYETSICGLIAAETVAALGGRPAKNMPVELANWVSDRRAGEVDPGLRQLAIVAVERIKEDSEIAELWARSSVLADWVAKVDDLSARLQR